MVKNLKVFPNVVLLAEIKHFGTLNATQKTAALYKAPLLKKKEEKKTVRNWSFLTKNAFLTSFRQYFLIFHKRCFVEGCDFLCCVQCPKTLNSSYPKTTFVNIFKFFTIR